MSTKLKVSILLIFLSFVGYGSAQENYVEGANEFKYGGLGYFSIGYSFNVGNDLKNNLERTFLLHSPLPSIGFSIGGGGYFLFAKKFLVSGNGFGLSFQNVINKSNELVFGGGGGGASFGYVVFNRYDWMIFPSIGVGGMSMKMNIRNTADSLIYFGDYEIPLRKDVDFDFSQTYLDIGVSAHKIIQLNQGSPNVTGISFGLSVGYIAGFGENVWEVNGSEVGDLTPGKYNAFYIKISIGGGGFFIRKSD